MLEGKFGASWAPQIKRLTLARELVLVLAPALFSQRTWASHFLSGPWFPHLKRDQQSRQCQRRCSVTLGLTRPGVPFGHVPVMQSLLQATALVPSPAVPRCLPLNRPPTPRSRGGAGAPTYPCFRASLGPSHRGGRGVGWKEYWAVAQPNCPTCLKAGTFSGSQYLHCQTGPRTLVWPSYLRST